MQKSRSVFRFTGQVLIWFGLSAAVTVLGTDIAGPAVVDRDREGCGTTRVRRRCKGQRAGSIRAGVSDGGIWNQAGIARRGSDREGLALVGGTGADAGKIYSLT